MKKYDSVLAMVRDTSDKEFADKFEATLKEKTVYVYVDVSLNVEVFTSLRKAKAWYKKNYPDRKLEMVIKDLKWSDIYKVVIWRKKLDSAF
jgi:hypothetical protein